MKDEVKLDDPTYNRSLNFAAPVFNAHADYMSIFKSLSKDPDRISIINADEEGFLYVNYTTEHQVKWNSILDIGTYDETLSIPMPTKAAEGFSKNLTFPHMINTDSTIRIDSVLINASTLKIDIGALPIDGIATIAFNELTINGKAFSDNWDISEGLNKSYDLSGYQLTPTHSDDSCLMTCQIRMAGTCTETAINNLYIQIKMSDITPNIAFGYFGQKEVLNKDDNSNIKFFSEFDIPSSIRLKGMSINLNVDNHTGTPFNLKMDNMRLVTAGGDTLPVRFLDTNTIFVDQIAYTDYNPSGNTPKSNKYLLDSTNSNIDDILNSSPIDYKYTLKIESNPKGEVQQNFITPETELDASINVYVPFWAKIENLNRSDTFNFNINDIILSEDNADYIDTMIIAMKFSNGFPFSFSTQGYLVDEDYNIVDSLFPGQKKLWKMPEFDDNLKVSEWTESESDVIFDNKKIKRCSEADVKYVVLNTNVSTSDMPGKYFRLYKDYGLNMRLAIELVGKYTNE